MQKIKPFSEACEQNKTPILTCIQPLLKHKKSVFEIGSGTGQHAIHFAKAMPHLSWQCSDREKNISGICQWLDEANLANTPKPLPLDVSEHPWPKITCDTVFSANAVHIMSLKHVEKMLKNATALLPEGGYLLLYGPFNYNNTYTSDSNAQFDIWLHQQDPNSGIRNFETLDKLAHQGDMLLANDFPMPANNRILQWVKSKRTAEGYTR